MGELRRQSLWLLLLAAGLVAGTATGVVLALGPKDRVALPVAQAAPPVRSELVTCVGVPLAERAAQTLVVGLPSVLEEDDPLVEELLDVGVGGVLLTKTNVASEVQVRRLVGALRRGSLHGLLVTTDEEPGRVSSFREIVGASSSARTLARRSEPGEVALLARALGEQLAAMGIDAAFAPVVDLDDGPDRSIIGDRSFSADPAVTADYGVAFSSGLASAGVHPTAKHFPGHGRSRTDTHRSRGLVEAPLAELRTSDLVPFARQIRAGVPLVMVNHLAYEALDPDLPASLAAPTYALLREMGFDGVAITDSTGMGAVHREWDFAMSAVMAIRAGADAVLATDGGQARAMRDALVTAVGAGELDADRLDEAAARMLALKGEDPHDVVCRDVAPIPTMRPLPRSALD